MKPESVFEVSWEVCNKVGGIYTVVSSKAAQMVAHYQTSYVAVGPFFTLDKVKGEFEELPMPDSYKRVADTVASKGIRLHWGTWLIPGSPHTLLVDFSESLAGVNEIKRRLWEAYQINSLNTGDDISFPFAWAWSVGNVLEAFGQLSGSKDIVAHFHEWLSAPGLLYLRQANSPIKTVFTTHATVLGRSLAESDVSLYERMETIDVDKEAYRLGVAVKHQTERAAAHACHILTTVSDITALEVELFFGRKVDGVLPNGLDMSKYPTIEEIALAHRLARDRMREFLLYYFLPYYDIDVANTLFYFISGRYEVRNKGIDVFISALGKLNEALTEKRDAKTIIALLFIPTGVRGINAQLIENREWFRDMQRTLEEVHDTFLDNVMERVLRQKALTIESLFGEDRAKDLDIKKKKFRRSGTPPLSTHELLDKNDPIIKLLTQAKLANAPTDKVKVIYYPTYLNGGDGLLNLDYQEVVTGSHFGMFPSLYEPWGYTPLETAALGVASLTSDYSGFGQFIETLKKEGKLPRLGAEGVYIVKRIARAYPDITGDLAAIMEEYAAFTREERVTNKLAAKTIAEFADWKHLVTYYFQSHERAIQAQ